VVEEVKNTRGSESQFILCGLKILSLPDPSERDACFLTLLAHITSQPEVLLVSPEPEIKSNNYYAARISQNGPIDPTPDTFGTPLWAIVDGSSQVVGLADSGIDENSCFFRDPVNGPVPRTPRGGTSVVDHAQRKIVQYGR